LICLPSFPTRRSSDLIGKVNAQQLSISTRSGVLDAWEETDNFATEDSGVVAQYRVAAHQDGLVRQVHCVVVPVSVNDDGDLCPIANDEAEVISVGAGAFVLHNQGHFSVAPNVERGRTERNIVLASA